MFDNLIVIIYSLLFETCLLVIFFWIMSVSSSYVDYFKIVVAVLMFPNAFMLLCAHALSLFLNWNTWLICSLVLFDWQYILKENAKNTTQKEKSNFIVVARREDQATTSSGKEIYDERGKFFLFLPIMNLSKRELFSYSVIFICCQIYIKFLLPTSVQDNRPH